MDEVLISVEKVSKKFCPSLKKSLWYGVQDIAREVNPFARDGADADVHGSSGVALREGEFWAVNNVSFELRRGECLGLIGRNGAGKTTLLRMLNGLIKPDHGRITMRGRVGALIALGAGFNPVLTGRENIYINASLLGLTKHEIDKKMEDIISFAEIGDFIDAPVQSYSSGMAVRLGFAVATALEPDVLLLDEVLAVGDVTFIIKCFNTIRKMMNQSAVILVSHSMQNISRFCTRVIVMEHGTIARDTNSMSEAIDCYLSQLPSHKTVTGTGDAVIRNIQLQTEDHSWHRDEEAIVIQGENLTVHFDVKILGPGSRKSRFTVAIEDQGQNPIIFFSPTGSERLQSADSHGEYHVTIELGRIDLNAGKYSLLINAEDEESKIRLVRLGGVGKFRVVSHHMSWAHIVRSANVHVEPAQLLHEKEH